MNPIRVAAFKRQIARAQATGVPAADLKALLEDLRETGSDPYELAFHIDRLLDKAPDRLMEASA